MLKKFLSHIKKFFRKKSRPKRKIPKRKRTKLHRKRPPQKKKKIATKRKIPKRPPLKKSKAAKPKVVEKKDTKPRGQLVGEITHYFSKIQVVVINLKKGGLKVGDMIRVEGRGQEFSQKVESLQIESVDVKVGKKGDLVGMKVREIAKEGDRVYKL